MKTELKAAELRTKQIIREEKRWAYFSFGLWLIITVGCAYSVSVKEKALSIFLALFSYIMFHVFVGIFKSAKDIEENPEHTINEILAGYRRE